MPAADRRAGRDGGAGRPARSGTMRFAILRERGSRRLIWFAVVGLLLAFGIGVACAPAAWAHAVTNATTSAVPNTAGVQGGFTAIRMLSYLSIAVFCGGLAFVAIVWPDGAEVARAQHLLIVAWIVGIVTSVLGLGFEGATILGKPLIAVLAPSVIGKSMTVEFGRVWAGKALLFVVALPLLWALRTQGVRASRSIGWRLAVVVVGLALLRTPGLIAHSSQGPYPDLGSIADLVHLTGVSLWIGGLIFMCAVVLPRRRPDELRTVVPRFSTLAMISVGAIVAGGAFLSWQLVGSVHGFVHTQFGHVLLWKVGVFALILGAAQLSRKWVAGRLNLAIVLGGDAETVRPLALSVAAEAGLALVVLTIASVLVNTNPVR